MVIRLGFQDQPQSEFSALVIRLGFQDQPQSEFSALVKPGLGLEAPPGVQIQPAAGH
jgi:hypothetical protein